VKVESHGQVGMEAIHICGPRSLCFSRTSVFAHRNGDDIFASRTEIRKENVRGDHALRQGYRRNGRRRVLSRPGSNQW